MKITIKTKHVKNRVSVESYIDRRIHFALDRMKSRIASVNVFLQDETKGSHRFDGSCRIDIELMTRGNVHVTAHGESPHECFLKAIHTIENKVKTTLQKRNHSSRIRHKKNKRELTSLY